MKIKSLSAKTPNQKQYIQTILNNDIIFAVGPPGTGKSFVPLALAICELCHEKIDQIVYTRPIVAVGGRDLGALPGTHTEKLEPYIMQMFDIASKFLEKRELENYRRNGNIEICPVGLLRGRTIDGWLICTESQSLTKDELRAILTRIGEGGKIIIEGDLNQSDLSQRDKILVQSPVNSRYDEYKLPLAVCIDKLYDIPGVGVVTLDASDIQRNKIIGQIEKALQGEW